MQLEQSSRLDSWLNSRPALHISFWSFYYLYRVFIYGDVVNTYENVAYVQAFELILKVPVVYINLYLFLPIFLKKKKTLYFFAANILLIGAATFLQTYMIKFCISLGIYDYRPDSYLWSAWKVISRANHFVTLTSVAVVIKVLKDFYFKQQSTQQLEREKLETELKFLRSQINPHFFFNTLNNLYSMVERKDDMAGSTLLKLSDLMSYMIYDASNKKVTLQQEVDNLKNFIALEQLRFAGLNVKFDIEGQLSRSQIAPLLLVPFLENAFKHGVGKESKDNSIHIELTIKGSMLYYRVSNPCSAQDSQLKSEQRGIGLENLGRRLEILYPDHYTLTTEENDGTYVATLDIDLNKYAEQDAD